MEKWLDAFAKWPPMNQLAFSCVLILVGVLVLFLFGVWLVQILRYAVIALRGWPVDKPEDTPTNKPPVAQVVSTPAAISSSDMSTILALLEEVRQRPILAGPSGRNGTGGGLSSVGSDWRQEAKRMWEEEEYQAELQQKLLDECEALDTKPASQ